MKISIITPVTRHDDLLDATMQSVLEQSYPHSEHIVAWYREQGTQSMSPGETNQGSANASIKTRSFQEALNNSLKHVDGGYLMVLPSGKTFASKYTLENIVGILSDTKGNLLYGKSRVFNDSDVLNNMVNRWDKKRKTHPLPFGKIPLNTVIIIKQSLLESAGLKNGKLSVNSEYELNLKVFMHPTIHPVYMDEYLLSPSVPKVKNEQKEEAEEQASLRNLKGLKYLTNLW